MLSFSFINISVILLSGVFWGSSEVHCELNRAKCTERPFSATVSHSRVAGPREGDSG